MKRIFSLLAVVLACAATNLNAQDTAVKEEAETPNYRPFTLSVEASSTGPGLAADWRFADHFGARVGANGFLGLFDSEGLDVGHKEIEGINYEITLKPWMSEQLALDIYPWKKSTFRITAGVLLNQSKVEGDMPQSSSAVHSSPSVQEFTKLLILVCTRKSNIGPCALFFRSVQTFISMKPNIGPSAANLALHIQVVQMSPWFKAGLSR